MFGIATAANSSNFPVQARIRQPHEIFDNLDNLLCLLRDNGSVSLIAIQIERVTEYILDYEEAWSMAPSCPGGEQANREICQAIIDAVTTITARLTRMDDYAVIRQFAKPVTEFVDRARRRLRQDQSNFHFG